VLVLAVLDGAAHAVEFQNRGRRICRVWLVSDAVEDRSSLEAVLGCVLKPRMSDEKKCLALLQFAHGSRFWAPSSRPTDVGIEDPVVLMNCFAPTICQQDAAVLCASLWTAAGFPARYWQLGGHTTSEVFFDGAWRNLDATFGTAYRKNNRIAGVVEANPMYKPGKSYETLWNDYELGHRMEMTFRRGESFTRYWGPVSTKPGYWRPGADGKMPDDRKGQRRCLHTIMADKPYTFDTQGCGFGNGVWTFVPDFEDPRWREVVEREDGIAVAMGAQNTPAVRPAAVGKKSELILRVANPYVISGAWIEGRLTRGSAQDEFRLSVSVNNGATWKHIWQAANTGVETLSVPLAEVVGRQFSYLVKIEMQVAERPESLKLSRLRLKSVVHLNPFSLPALKSGTNTIRLTAGEQTETLTVYPDLDTPQYREITLEETNIGTAREQLQETWVTGLCAQKPDVESLLRLKVVTPGVMRRVRWGGRRLASGVNELTYSLDGLRWHTLPWTGRDSSRRLKGKSVYVAEYETLERLPAGTRAVWLGYRFLRERPREHCQMHLVSSIRIDADYVPPGLGRTPPLEVTYCWAERKGSEEVERTHTELAGKLPHEYRIEVNRDAKPRMKWARMQYVAGP